MLATLNRHRFEVLLALAAAVVLYYGAQGLLAMQDAQAAFVDARDTQREIEAEAAQYNVEALRVERDRLLASGPVSAFPTADEVEQDIGVIASLLEDPLIELGPIVMGDIADEVTDADIGQPGTGARQYGGVEMLLSLDGDVFDLLDLANRILASVPNATFQDVSLTLAEEPGEPSTLSVRVVLYYHE